MDKKKIIFDINISSVEDLHSILLNKGYDFVTLEPEESKVSVKFRKDGKIVDERFIKYPIYSKIVIKSKTISNLDVGVTSEMQEGNGEIELNGKKFNALTKVVPGDLGEKLFLKLKVIEIKTNSGKTPKKIDLGKMIGFFGALLIILLIVGGSFLAFIVLNAKDVDDVRFFLTLGVNLNEINSFISKTVQVFFSLLVLVLTLFLVIFLFKFLLTKKIFKKKKARYGIVALLFFILTFSSASGWIFLDRKIRDLPEWDILALGDVQVYDNSKLKSESFTRTSSFIEDTTKLIGPIEIKFDLTQLASKEEKGGLKIKKYIWSFGENIRQEETLVPELIKKFNDKGNYDMEVEIELVDETNNVTTKKLRNLPRIGIQYVVSIREKELNSGGKQVTFDASSLKELGKAEWYTENSGDTPIHEGSIYITNPIFSETMIGLYLRNENKKSTDLDKIFIIDGEQGAKISGEIDFVRSPIDDKEFTFKVINPKANEGIGFIEKFIWRIDGKEYKLEGEIDNQEKSSEVKHTFLNYGKFEVTVELIPTSGETKKVKKTIEVNKELKIKEGIKFSVDGESIDNVRRNELSGEYILNDFGIPAKLEFDARNVKADNIIYSLEDISWDYNSDGNIDAKGKRGEVMINKEGREKITVNYKFKNIRVEDDIINIKEIVYIEAVRKSYDVSFKMNQRTEYAPAIIGFDATKSYVKDSNISKFIWDFGDGIIEEGDAVIQGHRYLKEGEYDIGLTIVTSDGKRYSTTKKLILKPKAQKVKIKASMKTAPILQGIDFDSSESVGDITGYFWDFGDGNVSTDANPTHTYKKPGEYTVKLKADFRNRNIMEDTMKIIITR